MIEDVIAKANKARAKLETAESFLLLVQEKIDEALVELNEIQGQMDNSHVGYAVAHVHDVRTQAARGHDGCSAARYNISVLIRTLNS